MASFIKEMGIQPSYVCYRFKEEELVRLLAAYTQKELGYPLTFEWDWDYDGVTSKLSKKDFEAEHSDADEIKIFEEWDVEDMGADYVLADLFEQSKGSLFVEYLKEMGVYEISIGFSDGDVNNGLS